jgi:sortase A
MNKANPSSKKRLIFPIISLVIIATGLVLSFWALINIGQEKAIVAATYKNVDAGTSEITAIKPEVVAADAFEMETAESSKTTVVEDKLYSKYPVEGETIGNLSIPVLGQNMTIIQGSDTEDLKIGVGHFTQSVLPGENDNCVLSGHRGTLFSRLGELKKDDLLITKTTAGTFTYKVTGTRIVDRYDRTVIVPTDHAVLTLSTCYPFGVFGVALQRYIVSADLVKSELT